jgi:hypothetical protein
VWQEVERWLATTQDLNRLQKSVRMQLLDSYLAEAYRGTLSYVDAKAAMLQIKSCIIY